MILLQTCLLIISNLLSRVFTTLIRPCLARSSIPPALENKRKPFQQGTDDNTIKQNFLPWVVPNFGKRQTSEQNRHACAKIRDYAQSKAQASVYMKLYAVLINFLPIRRKERLFIDSNFCCFLCSIFIVLYCSSFHFLWNKVELDYNRWNLQDTVCRAENDFKMFFKIPLQD